MINKALIGKLVQATYKSNPNSIRYGVLVEPDELILSRGLRAHACNKEYWAMWEDTPQKAIESYEKITEENLDYVSNMSCLKVTYIYDDEADFLSLNSTTLDWFRARTPRIW